MSSVVSHSDGPERTRDAGREAVTAGRRLKVLILSKDLDAPGGVVHFVSFLMDHFSDRIDSVHLPIGRATEGGGVLHNLFFPVVNAVSLIRALLRERYDCVHVNPSLNFSSLLRDGLFMGILRLMRQRNVVVYFHGWSDTDAKRIGHSPLLRSLFKVMFGRACVILVLASRFKETLIAMGIPEERVRVTSTMFDGRIFDGLEPRERRNGERLIFMSRFVREKGVYELLDAFASIAAKYPGAHLTLLGDGPEREGMEQRAAALELGRRITFAGYKRKGEKAQLLLDSDLFVFPTYYGEGCPVALLEAMAAGLPVVTHGAGGIPDLFRDGENGVLLDEVTPVLVEQAIDRLLGDTELRREIGERNREYAWAHFEAGVVTRTVEEVYQRVAECC